MIMTINDTLSPNQRAPSWWPLRAELALIPDSAQELRWLRPKLKQAITFAYAWGVIDATTTQHLINRFELWSA
jgi:hypothetical protein